MIGGKHCLIVDSEFRYLDQSKHIGEHRLIVDGRFLIPLFASKPVIVVMAKTVEVQS